VMLRSQANLVASKMADWDDGARATARLILDRMAAQARAGEIREVRSYFPKADDAFMALAKERCGVTAPFGGVTPTGVLTLHCATDQVHALAVMLREAGAETVSVVALDYVFARDNALFAKLEAGLKD
jgi:ATP phosphoribosyltransferase